MYKPLFVSAVCVVCAFAQGETQNSGPVTKAPPGGPLMIQFDGVGDVGALGFAPIGANSRVVGAPYSAQSSTERVQTLADGNRIVETTSSTIARDSQGRVRMERSGPSMDDPNAPRLITVEDPVAGYNYTLDSRTKTAFKMPAPKNLALDLGTDKSTGSQVRLTTKAGSPEGPNVTAWAPMGAGPVFSIVKDNPSEGVSVVKTDLGSQTMEGVLARGTRISRTIPAGSIGNEQPIVITTETWYSPDLKTLVMSKSSDPRIGETTYKLTDIQRAEPSPALFQVPADYTVKDRNFFFRTEVPNGK